jgi:hypothetical protein
MVTAAQFVGNVNENFFDFFDLAVKKFCGSKIVGGSASTIFWVYLSKTHSPETAGTPFAGAANCFRSNLKGRDAGLGYIPRGFALQNPKSKNGMGYGEMQEFARSANWRRKPAGMDAGVNRFPGFCGKPP